MSAREKSSRLNGGGVNSGLKGLIPEFLLQRRYQRAAVMTILLFAVGLVGFFIFSAGCGDGLEATMENAGAGESSYFSAPLSYGNDYPHALLSGIIGFFIVLLSVNYYGKLMRRKNHEKLVERKKGD